MPSTATTIQRNTSANIWEREEQEEQQRHQGLVWFSYYQKEYQLSGLGLKKSFRWKEKEPPKRWDWDNCWVYRAKILPDRKVRIVIRSKTNRNSNYLGKIPVELRFMLGIDIECISEPYTDSYNLKMSDRRNLPSSARITHKRWAFKLDNKYWIWQWAKEGVDIKSTRIQNLYEDIRDFLREASYDSEGRQDEPKSSVAEISTKDNGQKNDESGINNDNRKENIFKVKIDESFNEFVPVIYQPAVDSLRNFVREVHCKKSANPDLTTDLEVCLLFNNEALRRHKILNRIYEKIRHVFYGRVLDLETFRVHFDSDNDTLYNSANVDRTRNGNHNGNSKDGDYFTFQNIYSEKHGIEEDTIHLDSKPPVPHRNIEYYFIDRFHPIVFINTANHAMSEHDNNHELWKWEYIPWVKKAPIKFGTKSRHDIDCLYPSLFKRIAGKMKWR